MAIYIIALLLIIGLSIFIQKQSNGNYFGGVVISNIILGLYNVIPAIGFEENNLLIYQLNYAIASMIFFNIGCFAYLFLRSTTKDV